MASARPRGDERKLGASAASRYYSAALAGAMALTVPLCALALMVALVAVKPAARGKERADPLGQVVQRALPRSAP